MHVRTAVAMLGLLIVGCSSRVVRLEAEDAQLKGVEVATTQPAIPSGGKYVTGMDAGDDAITFRPDLPPGLYEAVLGYRTPSGRKAFGMKVGDRTIENIFTESREDFARQKVGLIDLPPRGEITILRGWGYYDLDYLELKRVEKPAPAQKVPANLVDKAATPETRRLMRYLTAMYGAKILSGGYGSKESDYVYQATGERPAIRGLDMMEYSPSRREHGAHPGDLMAEAIALHRAGQIITISWHWNAPAGLVDAMLEGEGGTKIDARWYKGFNTNATTFDLEQALRDPQSAEYQLLLRDIDVIATELKKLQAAGVPVLWRPLHEADGKWFWWGAKGPGPFKQLWRLMRERMTNLRGLHNLIWVYTGTQLLDWYPGDDQVDIFGIDAYTPRSDPLSGPWEILQDRFAGKKLVAISEYGGIPDVEALRQFGCWYSYFVSWGGAEGPVKVSKEELARAYNYWGVANLDDLPKWKSKPFPSR